MSKYGEFSTEFADGGHLAAALRAMGFKYEVNSLPVTLFDCYGVPRPETANIVIRRQHTGLYASNDIGFSYDVSSGTFKAIISEYDSQEKFTPAWLDLLKQNYTEQRQIAVGRQRGWVFQGREVVQLPDGRQQVRLQFKGR